MLPDMLTVADLATLLDCNTATVEDRTRARQLPGLKFGRSWVYPRDAVLEVLRQQALAHVRTPGGLSKVAAHSAVAAAQKIAVVPQRPAPRPRGRTPAPLGDPPGQVGGQAERGALP